MVEIVRSEGGRLRCGATRWFVIDAGRPFFIGQPTCGVVERQGSEPATSRRPDSTRLSAPGRASVIPGGGNSRPHPGGGCHLAKSRRDTWRCCSWGSLFRSGRFSRPEEILRLLFIALVGLGLNSAVVLLLAKFCGSIRRSRKSCLFPVLELELSWPTLDRVRRNPPAVTPLLAERIHRRLSS